MPALRNWSTAHSTAARPDGNPEMRPHIWPLPISFEARDVFAKPTIVSTSALIAAPLNSGVAGSEAIGRGGRAPTLTAASPLASGGSVTPNHGPALGAAGRRAGSS